MFPSLCGITSITYSSLEILCILLFLFKADRDHIKALPLPGLSSKPRLCCSKCQEWNNEVEDVGMKKRITVKDMYDDDGYIAADVQCQISSESMYQQPMQTFGDGMYGDECGYKVMGTRSKKLSICMGTEGHTANVATNPAIIPHNDDCYDSVQIHKAWQ